MEDMAEEDDDAASAVAAVEARATIRAVSATEEITTARILRRVDLPTFDLFRSPHLTRKIQDQRNLREFTGPTLMMISALRTTHKQQHTKLQAMSLRGEP